MCASSVRVSTVFPDDRTGRISIRTTLLVGDLGRLGRLAKGHGVSGCETKTVKASQIRDNDSPCASKSSRETDRSTSLRQCYRSRPRECPCGVRLDRQIPRVRAGQERLSNSLPDVHPNARAATQLHSANTRSMGSRVSRVLSPGKRSHPPTPTHRGIKNISATTCSN